MIIYYCLLLLLFSVQHNIILSVDVVHHVCVW